MRRVISSMVVLFCAVIGSLALPEHAFADTYTYTYTINYVGCSLICGTSSWIEPSVLTTTTTIPGSAITSTLPNVLDIIIGDPHNFGCGFDCIEEDLIGGAGVIGTNFGQPLNAPGIYGGNGGVTLSIVDTAPAATPEPSTLSLMAEAGILGLLLARRKRSLPIELLR